ncbi:MAG: sigma 54-interacting transcriptional regulator, partial [Polyangiaceae bacterium]
MLLAPEPGIQRRVQMALGRHGILVAAAASPTDARRLIELERPAALVVDARRPDVRSFATSQPEEGPALLGLIDAADRDAASDLLTSGAHEIVPITLIEPLLMHRLRDALEQARQSPSKPPPRRTSNLLVGRSPAMVEAVARIEVIAKSDMGAAIFGETGTGKELAARTIHLRSRRAGKPLVVANCTALPEALFENELFGHERGAFTGADSRREGLLAEAEGGTLLLDEIGDITPGVQAKLLRLLQFHEYKMV